jgi:hypothetical protein
MFYLDVAKVDLILHMLQCLYTYVVSVCFKYFRRKLQVAYLDVAYVALDIHVCCKCMFSNVSAVSNICCKCVYLDVAYVVVAIHVYFISVCFKCFSCFKCMLQVFHLDVAYVEVAIHICCKSVF